MQHRPCFTSRYSWSGTFGMARRIQICLHYSSVRLKEDMSPTLLFFSPPLYVLYVSNPTPLTTCPFPLSLCSLDHFFPSGHCPLPFVHNVRLFIFHSCLLPCSFYFLLPPFLFLFFFLSKRCILNCIGTILKCIRDVLFWPFLIWYNCLKQILFFNLPMFVSSVLLFNI